MTPRALLSFAIVASLLVACSVGDPGGATEHEARTVGAPRVPAPEAPADPTPRTCDALPASSPPCEPVGSCAPKELVTQHDGPMAPAFVADATHFYWGGATSNVLGTLGSGGIEGAIWRAPKNAPNAIELVARSWAPIQLRERGAHLYAMERCDAGERVTRIAKDCRESCEVDVLHEGNFADLAVTAEGDVAMATYQGLAVAAAADVFRTIILDPTPVRRVVRSDDGVYYVSSGGVVRRFVSNEPLSIAAINPAMDGATLLHLDCESFYAVDREGRVLAVPRTKTTPAPPPRDLAVRGGVLAAAADERYLYLSLHGRGVVRVRKDGALIEDLFADDVASLVLDATHLYYAPDRMLLRWRR